ncbi:MAG: ATP-binding protein [Flavobacteriia bacterium]|nr:ATP-binding protein [Flavobacteriia bacterium]
MKATIEQIQEQYKRLIKTVPLSLERSLMNEINWDAKLIGIKGARGVGKTTLLLQYIKKNHSKNLHKTLYLSLDSIWFAENSLLDLADDFSNQGGKYLFLDEVHKYKNWSQELKNIYDSYPDLKVVFTGSSLLDILNARADLSRRALVYTMQGLSFREYMQLKTSIALPFYSLNDILNHHEEISIEITENVKPLVYFSEYLKHGYYPYYFELPDLYYLRINEITNMILEIELPLLRGVEINYIHRIKQLLFIISQSVPFVPNVTKLSEKIGIQRGTLLAYFHYLDEVKLTKNLFKEAGGISKLQKPLKVYLENTNLMYAISYENINWGTLRETFFANQLSFHHQVQYSVKGDFLVDEKYIFEIGGKTKNMNQIEGLKNVYIAADEIEYGWKSKIPLWLFGFMY